MITDQQRQQLIEAARQARDRAYAPYSDFQVGAAVLTAGGEIISGCNVESTSYGLTICAERIALGSALSQGFRDFQAIALWADGTAKTWPCGACRQWIAEHLPPDAPVIKGTDEGFKHQTVEELLPRPFLYFNPHDESGAENS